MVCPGLTATGPKGKERLGRRMCAKRWAVCKGRHLSDIRTQITTPALIRTCRVTTNHTISAPMHNHTACQVIHFKRRVGLELTLIEGKYERHELETSFRQEGAGPGSCPPTSTIADKCMAYGRLAGHHGAWSRHTACTRAGTRSQACHSAAASCYI